MPSDQQSNRHQIQIPRLCSLGITVSVHRPEPSRFILVFAKMFTRWVEAFALPDTQAPTVADILLREIVFRFGTPSELLSDRGRNFLSKVLREVNDALRIHRIHTSAYHQKTNGMVERYNGTLTKTLSHFSNEVQSDWDQKIPAALFTEPHPTPPPKKPLSFYHLVETPEHP